MFTGEPLPAEVLSANAYLGALPIARALAAGADIVITGRCVDSAVTLGALIHEFGWSPDDYDRLAGGSLAGHIIECGCQATGGLFTDWQQVPDWAHIGYPIIDCRDDGSFVLTKPPGTGGLVRAPRRRADALRDRRSARLPAARRQLRLPRGAHRAGRRRPRARQRRPRARADRTLQGVGDATGRLPLRRADGHRRHRCGGQGATHGRGHRRAHARLLAEAGLPDYTRGHDRTARRRNAVRPRTRAPRRRAR